jgi:transcriptional regulator with XRE-family HTH domain
MNTTTESPTSTKLHPNDVRGLRVHKAMALVRTNANVSVADAAERAGISVATWSRMEAGTQRPTREGWAAVCAAFPILSSMRPRGLKTRGELAAEGKKRAKSEKAPKAPKAPRARKTEPTVLPTVAAGYDPEALIDLATSLGAFRALDEDERVAIVNILDAAQGCGMTIKQLSDMLSKMGGK